MFIIDIKTKVYRQRDEGLTISESYGKVKSFNYNIILFMHDLLHDMILSYEHDLYIPFAMICYMYCLMILDDSRPQQIVL
jgi:hypothetical protein